MRHHRRRLTTAALAAAIVTSALAPGVAAADVELSVPAPATTALTSSTADRAVAAALAQVGVPYVWGGTTSRGFDCSGLVQWAYRQAGVSLPRTAAAQSGVGKSVSLSQAQPGDLLFYRYGRNIDHVAMVVGGGMLVEAPQPGSRVSTRRIYTKHLAAVRRVG